MHKLIYSQQNPVRIEQATSFSKLLNFREIIFPQVSPYYR